MVTFTLTKDIVYNSPFIRIKPILLKLWYAHNVGVVHVIVYVIMLHYVTS